MKSGLLWTLPLVMALGAQAPATPKFKFDPEWPKPLPKNGSWEGLRG